MAATLTARYQCGEGTECYPLSCGSWLACDGGLPADAYYLTPHGPNVGAGLLAKAAWQSTQLDRVHIRYLGNGHLGFRPDVNCPPNVGHLPPRESVP